MNGRAAPTLRQRIRDTLDAHAVSIVDECDEEASARVIPLDTTAAMRALAEELTQIALDHGALE